MELLAQFSITRGAACLSEYYSNFNSVRTGCAVCIMICLETRAGGEEIGHVLGNQLKEQANYICKKTILKKINFVHLIKNWKN